MMTKHFGKFSFPFLFIMLSACSVLPESLTSSKGTFLPNSGPNPTRVLDLKNAPQVGTNTQTLPTVSVIDVDDMVAQQLYLSQNRQQFADLGGQNGSVDKVNVGDILEITIWESPPALLFGGALNSMGSGMAQSMKLPEQMVNEQGKVSVPFLGALVVRGKTPEQIQNEIVQKLKRMANQPQALVRIVKNNSSNVTILRAGQSVRMPLTGHRERILDAVAAIGGSESDVRDVSVQLTRKNQVRVMALETITADPNQNIVLQAGDVLTLQNKPLSFTALGAVGKNQKFSFGAKGLNLGEAMGEMGGLQDHRADPSGVFVFRYQNLASLPSEEQQTWLAKGYQAHMDIPVVYRMDLLNPNALFWLQRFPIQDKDIVYVANARGTELQKFLQLIFSPVVNGVNSVNNIIR